MSAHLLRETDRQLLPLLCEGLSYAEMAKRLWLTEHAVRSRVTALCRRLGARNRSEAVHVAYSLGVLQPGDVPIPKTPRPEVVRVPHDPAEVIAARRAVLLGIDERESA